jgi:hypothetical protein
VLIDLLLYYKQSSSERNKDQSGPCEALSLPAFLSPYPSPTQRAGR